MGAHGKSVRMVTVVCLAAGSLFASAGAAEATPVPSNTGWAAIADDSAHTMTLWHGDQLMRTIAISMGRAKYPTPYGTYHTMEKYRRLTMNSATIGIPVDSPDGYITPTQYAIRLTTGGIFIHGAPWSIAQQGNTNVSHGCINVSLDNARFMYENLPTGTPVLIRP